MLERFVTDTQATDIVTFDSKGTGVRCVVCDTVDYQMKEFYEYTPSNRDRLAQLGSFSTVATVLDDS